MQSSFDFPRLLRRIELNDVVCQSLRILKRIANALAKGETELREQVIHVVRPILECSLAITTSSTVLMRWRKSSRYALLPVFVSLR